MVDFSFLLTSTGIHDYNHLVSMNQKPEFQMDNLFEDAMEAADADIGKLTKNVISFYLRTAHYFLREA